MTMIRGWMARDELKIQAGMNIQAGVREHFKDVKGGHKCKLCGEVVAHPRAAAAHMGAHHKAELEAGGPGSGPQGGGGFERNDAFEKAVGDAIRQGKIHTQPGDPGIATKSPYIYVSKKARK